MIIAPEFAPEISLPMGLSNEAFLRQSIWWAKHVFIDEMVFIKNLRCEFVALSDKAAEEFNFDQAILGKTFYAAEGIQKTIQDSIHSHELQLLSDRKMQTSFYFYKKQGEICNYSVTKRVLVNPETKDVVGILINSTKVVPNVHRKFIMQQFFDLVKPTITPANCKLTSLQKQILFCLLMGINNRKEITLTLRNITGLHITENQVKNSLQALYHTFKCSSASQLVNLILLEQIPFEIPADTLPLGNYLI